MNEATPALSRRQIVRDHRRERRRSGRLPGDDPPWTRGGIVISRPDQARRRSQGRLGHRSRRRARRNDRGDRARARRLQSERARIQFAPGRAELEPPGRRRLHGARRRDAKMRVRPRPLSQSRAHGAFPTIITRSWIIAAVSGSRSNPSSSSITTPICIPTNAFDGKPQRIREIKADFDGGVAELLAKATQKGALDDAVSTEDQRNPARGGAVAGRARQELPLPGRRGFSGSSRLCQASRRRTWRGADRGRADRACTIF